MLILSVLPLTNRLMALSVLPMRVASCAWVINFMFLHEFLHPLLDISGQVGSLHMPHLFPVNSLLSLYLIKPA